MTESYGVADVDMLSRTLGGVRKHQFDSGHKNVRHRHVSPSSDLQLALNSKRQSDLGGRD